MPSLLVALFGLIACAPKVRMFRPQHWADTGVLAVVMVVFFLLLVGSFRHAHRVIGPRLQELESNVPP